MHGADVRQRGERAPRAAPHLARRGRSARRRDRALLDPRSEGCARVRAAAAAVARLARRGARDRHARVFREAAHDRRLERAHQRPRPRRQLQHQQGLEARPPLALRDQRDGVAGRRRVSRHDLAAVHLGSRRVGRDRRAHDREPGASRAGVGLVVPRRVQERHRRQRQDCRRRRRCRLASAPFPGRDQGRSGDRGGDGRQSGWARHPARR